MLAFRYTCFSSQICNSHYHILQDLPSPQVFQTRVYPKNYVGSKIYIYEDELGKFWQNVSLLETFFVTEHFSSQKICCLTLDSDFLKK